LLLADLYLQQAIYTVLCINVVGIAIFLLEKVPERRSGLRPSDNKLPEQRSGNSVTKIPLVI
jgi:hypothetical protein